MQSPQSSSNSPKTIQAGQRRVAVWTVIAVGVAALAVLAYSRVPGRTAAVQSWDPNLHGSAMDSATPDSQSTTIAKTANTVSDDAATVAKRDYLPINFTLLSLFPFQETQEMHDLAKYPQATAKTLEQLPSYVKTYDGRKVELDGFMMPLAARDGLITKFLLMANQSSCCYGAVPQMNEWVEVDVKGKGVKDNMDVVIKVSGTFRVGEYRTSKGLLSGIYRMDAEKVEVTEPEPEAEAL